MNALLLGAASLGAIAVFLTTDPRATALAQTAAGQVQPMREEVAHPTKMALPTKMILAGRPRTAKSAIRGAPARKVASEQEDPDAMTHTTLLDAQTGEKTEINIIAFNDG